MACTFCSVSPAFGSSFTYAKRTDHVIFDAGLARNEKALRMLGVAVFVPRKNICSQPSTWRIHHSEKGGAAAGGHSRRWVRRGDGGHSVPGKRADNKKPPEGGL
jgi:hypothetical protein